MSNDTGPHYPDPLRFKPGYIAPRSAANFG